MRAIAAGALLLAALPATAFAQTLEGVWRGRTPDAPQESIEFELRIDAPNAEPAGRLHPLGRGAANPFLIDRAILSPEGTARIEIRTLRLVIEGKLGEDGKAIDGTWIQFESDRQPVRLTRTVSATPPTFFDPIVEIRIPKPPTAVVTDGVTRLYYEIHLANYTEELVELESVDFLIGDETATLSGDRLARQGISYGVSIPPSKSGGVIVGLSMSSEVPEVLRHRVRFRSAGRTTTLETQAIPVARNPVRLGPPLGDGDWWAGNGPDSSVHHRAAILPMDGRFTIAQRFAFDFAKRVPGSNDFERGDVRELTSSPSYGAEVLAVADGTVSLTRDGVPDSKPYTIAPPHPITKETLGGNLVVLDLGQQRWAVYAHLQPGSLRVKKGDRVRKGQVIARLGNSASYSAHLHFQVVDGPDPFSSEGVPFVFEEFAHEGKVHRDEMPSGGWTIRFRKAEAASQRE